jgi:hypothetical protein
MYSRGSRLPVTEITIACEVGHIGKRLQDMKCSIAGITSMDGKFGWDLGPSELAAQLYNHSTLNGRPFAKCTAGNFDYVG